MNEAMNEREFIVIGVTESTNGIIIEAFCTSGEYNLNLAENVLEKYERRFKIDTTDLSPEEILKEYSEAINNKQYYYYSIILTTSNKVRITTCTTRYPLKHTLSLLMTPGNHTILYGGTVNIEINATSYDYYYGEEAVITSSEVTSLS
jgi:hypothetical protein